MPAKRIYRNTREKVVAGVCAGIADYFDIDVAWIRLAFVLAVFASGFGLLAYVIAWIVFPREDRLHGLEGAARSDASATSPDGKPHESSMGQLRRKVGGGSLNVFGIVLILLGVLFFMDQNFWWFRFDAFWPVILIGLGLYMVLRPSSLASTSEATAPVHVATAVASDVPDQPEHPGES